MNLWPHISPSLKTLLAVGRTSRVQPQVSDEEMRGLLKYRPQLSLHRGRDHLMWSKLSTSQQLDLMATKLLAEDRARYFAKHNRRPKDNYLSADQYLRRSRRELPGLMMDVDHEPSEARMPPRSDRGWLPNTARPGKPWRNDYVTQ